MWVDLESISVGDTHLIPRSKKWIDLITQQGTINLVVSNLISFSRPVNL